MNHFMNHFDGIFENIDIYTGKLKTSIDALASLPTYAKHVVERILKGEGSLNEEDIFLMLSDLPTASEESLEAVISLTGMFHKLEYVPEFERALKLYAKAKLEDMRQYGTLFSWTGNESFAKALIQLGFIELIHPRMLFDFKEYETLAKRLTSTSYHSFYGKFRQSREFLEILAKEAEMKLGPNKNFYFTFEDGEEYFYANGELYEPL